MGCAGLSSGAGRKAFPPSGPSKRMGTSCSLALGAFSEWMSSCQNTNIHWATNGEPRANGWRNLRLFGTHGRFEILKDSRSSKGGIAWRLPVEAVPLRSGCVIGSAVVVAWLRLIYKRISLRLSMLRTLKSGATTFSLIRSPSDNLILSMHAPS
jgi:hypothetical protein